MATYRIVCTEQEPSYLPTTHAHIVAVGTGSDPDKASNRLTLAQVIHAIKNGNRFYTQGRTSGKVAWVYVVNCGHCRREIIRSGADAVYDNNLDSLRGCNFS